MCLPLHVNEGMELYGFQWNPAFAQGPLVIVGAFRGTSPFLPSQPYLGFLGTEGSGRDAVGRRQGDLVLPLLGMPTGACFSL